MGNPLHNWRIGAEAQIEPIASFSGKACWVTAPDGRQYVLKERKDRAAAMAEHSLLSRLKDSGVPVAPPLLAADGNPCATHAGRTYCLYPRLPGAPVEDHYTHGAEERARRFGDAIAEFHSAAADWECPIEMGRMDLPRTIGTWVSPRIDRRGDGDDTRRLREATGRFLDEFVPLSTELPTQLIHRDLHPSNMLFEGDVLTGILDLDMACWGPRIFDVCYCATAILADGFHDREKRDVWPRIFHALTGGYSEALTLSAAERRAICPVLVAIQLLFIAFSLEQANENAARHNRDMLIWIEENRASITP